MKSASVIQLAVFYLILLLSHEGITVAEKIRHSSNSRKRLDARMKGMKYHRHHNDQKHLRRQHSMKVTENRYAEHDSFLEAGAVQGLSVEAMGTMEIIGIHKSLHQHYRYKNSPIAEELNKLVPIPEGAILSRSELNERRDHIVVLLETAHTHKLVLDSAGNKAINDQKAIDQSLSLVGGMGAAIFGFVDGYFAGMASELRKLFEDPKCSDPDTVADLKIKMQAVGHRFKGVYGNLTTLHTKMFSAQGRTQVFGAMTGFGRSIVDFIRSAGLYVWNCPGAKFLAQMLLTMMVTFIQQLVMTTIMAAGGAVVAAAVKGAEALGENGKAMIESGKKAANAAVAAAKNVANKGVDAANGAIAKTGTGGIVSGAMQSMPILTKYAGMITALISSGYYFGKKGHAVYVDTKKVYNRTCDKSCQAHMIENSFAMSGIFTEVMINSGIDQIVKVERDKSKPFFESFNVGFQEEFLGDMAQLSEAASICKKGGTFKIPKLGSSPSSMMPSGVDKDREVKKEKSRAKYDADCKAGKNACWPEERWSKSYDHLQSPCMYSYKKAKRSGKSVQWKAFSSKCDNKAASVGMKLPGVSLKHVWNLMPGKSSGDKNSNAGNPNGTEPIETTTPPGINRDVDMSEVEDELEREIYHRVQKSEVTKAWREYLLESRLKGEVALCFRKWLRRWNGQPLGNCLEDEVGPELKDDNDDDDEAADSAATGSTSPPAVPPSYPTSTPGPKRIDEVTYILRESGPSGPPSPLPENDPDISDDDNEDDDDEIDFSSMRQQSMRAATSKAIKTKEAGMQEAAEVNSAIKEENADYDDELTALIQLNRKRLIKRKNDAA